MQDLDGRAGSGQPDGFRAGMIASRRRRLVADRG